jgi:N-acetylglucosamine-6-sulfatase
MRVTRIRFRTLYTLAIGLATTFASQATPVESPCGQITAACQRAGFVLGGARDGKGLEVHCIEPIMQGTAQPRKATTPLPLVDPQLVASCKLENPRFGQRRGPGLAAEEPQGPASPPPPGAIAQSTPTPTPSSAAKRPNIVFILTDDLAWNLVPYMPHVLQMQTAGVTFANYFVTDSLCCPSRASIFTGRYPHNTGIFRNTGTDGGYVAFRDRGHEGATFATALSAAGYRTAMLGKYLNGYFPAMHRPAPGWTSWAVAGNGYAEFRYNLNQDGSIVRHGDKPTDYLTDVLSDLAGRFIQRQAGAPFLIEVATFAPHAPYTPAPRDAAALPDVRAPRTPAFNAAPDADTPTWLRAHPPLSDTHIAAIDKDFRKRAQSMLAVDAMVGALQAAVAAIGEAHNTYFVFSSDNGYHMGEHRLMPGKMTAFDTDIRVPLIVTGPGVSAGRTVGEIVMNIDLYPTFLELGGAGIPANIDGRSLVPLLRGQKAAEWRTVALVEHRGPHRDPTDPDAPALRSGNPTTYEAIRGLSSVYVEYADGEREYHDLAADPDELHNTFSSLSGEAKTALHAMLGAVKICRDANSCRAAERPSPDVSRR